MKEQSQIEMYQTNDGSTQINVQFEEDSVWHSPPLSQSFLAKMQEP